MNQKIRDARSEEILSAAARVFARRGFASTKISDISREAGLSHGLVYHYFESKEAVLGAILDTMFERVRAELSNDVGRPIERIEAGLAHALRRCEERPEVGLLVTQAMLLGSMPPVVHERVRRHVRELHTLWVDLMRRGQRAGEITNDVAAEELVATVVAVIRGTSIRVPGMQDAPFAVPSCKTVMRLLHPQRPAPARSARAAVGSGASIPRRRGPDALRARKSHS